MALPVPIASFKTTITDKITSSATSISIDSTTDDDGNDMDGLVLFFTLDLGLSTEEYILGTVDTAGSQLTSVTRGLSVTDGTTSVAGNKSAHAKKSSIEITSHAYLNRAIRMLNGTEEVGGVMQNPSSRTINSSRDICDKEYVDLVAATAGGISAFATTDEGGLNIGVGAGYLVTGDGTVTYAGDTGFALTDDATNYVELTLDGTLVANTTSFTVGYVPVAIVTTVSGDITVNTDARGWLTAPSGDILVTNDATYGATIAAGDVLYLDTADAKWKLADGSAEATADGQLGIALDAGVDTNTNKRVQIGGLVSGLTGLTAGWVFVSDTAGDLSSSTGTYRRIVGYALNATTMFLISAQSADELTGGNSDLTVANLNEAATFFANTNATGAEMETLTSSSTSDADALHTHPNLVTPFTLSALFTEANGTSGVVLPGYSDDSSAFAAAVAFYGTATAVIEMPYMPLVGVPVIEASGNYTAATSGGVLRIGTDVWRSEAATIYKGNSTVTISGDAPAGDSALGHDPTLDYLLTLDNSTTVHRYSGIAGSTITYVDQITLDNAIDTDKGFLFDDANSEYYFLDGTDIRKFNSSGVTQSTTSIGFDYQDMIGLCFVNDRIYLICVIQGEEAAGSDSAYIGYIPTSITR
jgi:hypothetical protein